MHLPDGYLSTKVWIAGWLLSGTGITASLKQSKKLLEERTVPLMGLLSAFIFAAQMVNFPVGAGTSGHLLGAALAVILLGLAPAIVVMTTVLAVQCFIFQDGGLTAMGANLFNMAVIGPITAWAVYRGLRLIPGNGLTGVMIATGLASWCSVVAASAACATELALSGTIKFSLVFPAMTIVHMVIGIAEGVITCLILGFIWSVRKDLIIQDRGRIFSPGPADRRKVVVLFCILILIVILLSFFSSLLPDGLEKVAETLGFARGGSEPSFQAPLADYTWPGLESVFLSTALAGAAGAMIMVIVSAGIARLIVHRKRIRH